MSLLEKNSDPSIIEKIINIQKVIKCLCENRHTLGHQSLHRSDLWSELLAILSYVRNLPPPDLLNIRFHVGTGVILGTEWGGDFWLSRKFKEKILKADKIPLLKAFDEIHNITPQSLWCSEPVENPSDANLFFQYKGLFLSHDLLNRQHSVNRIQDFCLKNHDKETIVCEVGAGYGGLMHQLNRILKRSKFIIFDQPEILFFSAIYLSINNPKKVVYLYNPLEKISIDQMISESDFVLLPNYLSSSTVIKDHKIDLLINENSFPEMTHQQVLEYLQFAVKHSIREIYSFNSEKQFLNSQNKYNLTDVLMEYYTPINNLQDEVNQYGSNFNEDSKIKFLGYLKK